MSFTKSEHLHHSKCVSFFDIIRRLFMYAIHDPNFVLPHNALVWIAHHNGAIELYRVKHSFM